MQNKETHYSQCYKRSLIYTRQQHNIYNIAQSFDKVVSILKISVRVLVKSLL